MSHTHNALAALTLLIMMLPAAASATNPIAIPRTGQTACYDAAGDETGCDFTGQDGYMLAGAPWPARRFTDNGDGTVTDAMTGLMWTADAHLGGGARTWEEALEYVKTVDAGGYTDWRLPNVNELESLNDAATDEPALPPGHPFTDVQLSFYWTSTSFPFDARQAWAVNMSGGVIDRIYKQNLGQYLWPVRKAGPGALELPQTGQTSCYDRASNVVSCEGTGQDGESRVGSAWPAPRLQDNGDGTVTDLLTGLMWTADANPAGAPMTWREALDYISTIAVGGHDDWRLPNKKELRSLVEYSGSEPPLSQSPPFINPPAELYWSSTSHPRQFVHNFAWAVGMFGFVLPDTKPSTYCVWPVRAGQRGSDNDTSLMVIPRKMHRLPRYICPVQCFLLVGPKGTEFQRDFRVHWSDEAVTPLARVRLGKRIIMALVFADPFALKAGRCRVNVDYCRGGLDITRF